VACLMLVVYHTANFVPTDLRLNEPATWTLANLAVKLAHVAWYGVPMFFAVSGYCIAASINSLQRRPYSLSTFFARRFRRIYPPLWASYVWAILVTIAVAALWPSVYVRCPQLPRLDQFTASNWIGNLCLIESWRQHLIGPDPAYLANNNWTLCFEEQFYILSGLILFLTARRFSLGAMFVTAATLVARHSSHLHGLNFHGTFLEGHWLSFAAGLLLFHQLNLKTNRGKTVSYLAFGAAMIYAIVDRTFWAVTPEAKHIDSYILIGSAFAVTLAWLKNWDSLIASANLARPLFWCGKRSYSIYLTHYVIVVALSCAGHEAGFNTPFLWLTMVLPLCLCTSIACGWAFYSLVERHFLNTSVTEVARHTQPSLLCHLNAASRLDVLARIERTGRRSRLILSA